MGFNSGFKGLRDLLWSLRLGAWRYFQGVSATVVIRLHTSLPDVPIIRTALEENWCHLQCGRGRRQSGRPPYFLVPRPPALHRPVRLYYISSGAFRIVVSAPPAFAGKDGWSLSSTVTLAPSKYLHEPCRSDWSSPTSPADVPAQRWVESDLHRYPTPYVGAQYSVFVPYGVMLLTL